MNSDAKVDKQINRAERRQKQAAEAVRQRNAGKVFTQAMRDGAIQERVFAQCVNQAPFLVRLTIAARVLFARLGKWRQHD